MAGSRRTFWRHTGREPNHSPALLEVLTTLQTLGGRLTDEDLTRDRMGALNDVFVARARYKCRHWREVRIARR